LESNQQPEFMFLASELNRNSEQTTAGPLLAYTLSYRWDEKRVILLE
jgi:hypothetical protein